MINKSLRADYQTAADCMDNLYTIYMSAVESFGGDTNDPNTIAEGEWYARRKFVEIAEEFEKLYGPWTWAVEEGEEDE